MQISILLGTAYSASVGGVGTLIGTPPNAIVFGSGHLKQEHMTKVGVALNVIMTGVLTVFIWFLFTFV